MPAGCSDADLEMQALEAAGNRARKMWRPFTELEREMLESGCFVEKSTTNRETGERYAVLVRYVECDGVLEYALPAAPAEGYWRGSPRLARLAFLVHEKIGG